MAVPPANTPSSLILQQIITLTTEEFGGWVANSWSMNVGELLKEGLAKWADGKDINKKKLAEIRTWLYGKRIEDYLTGPAKSTPQPWFEFITSHIQSYVKVSKNHRPSRLLLCADRLITTPEADWAPISRTHPTVADHPRYKAEYSRSDTPVPDFIKSNDPPGPRTIKPTPGLADPNKNSDQSRKRSRSPDSEPDIGPEKPKRQKKDKEDKDKEKKEKKKDKEKEKEKKKVKKDKKDKEKPRLLKPWALSRQDRADGWRYYIKGDRCARCEANKYKWCKMFPAGLPRSCELCHYSKKQCVSKQNKTSEGYQENPYPAFKNPAPIPEHCLNWDFTNPHNNPKTSSDVESDASTTRSSSPDPMPGKSEPTPGQPAASSSSQPASSGPDPPSIDHKLDQLITLVGNITMPAPAPAPAPAPTAEIKNFLGRLEQRLAKVENGHTTLQKDISSLQATTAVLKKDVNTRAAQLKKLSERVDLGFTTVDQNLDAVTRSQKTILNEMKTIAGQSHAYFEGFNAVRGMLDEVLDLAYSSNDMMNEFWRNTIGPWQEDVNMGDGGVEDGSVEDVDMEGPIDGNGEQCPSDSGSEQKRAEPRPGAASSSEESEDNSSDKDSILAKAEAIQGLDDDDDEAFSIPDYPVVESPSQVVPMNIDPVSEDRTRSAEPAQPGEPLRPANEQTPVAKPDQLDQPDQPDQPDKSVQPAEPDQTSPLDQPAPEQHKRQVEEVNSPTQDLSLTLTSGRPAPTTRVGQALQKSIEMRRAAEAAEAEAAKAGAEAEEAQEDSDANASQPRKLQERAPKPPGPAAGQAKAKGTKKAKK